MLSTLTSALIWCACTWAYGWLFSWSEWVPGVNLVYLPHGLRVVLVILFAEAGAFGIVLGTALMGFELIRANPTLGLAHSLVAGAAVWLAAKFVIKPHDRLNPQLKVAGGMAAIDGRSLVLLALVSSVLNSSGHVLSWLMFDEQAKQLEVRFATMFGGDLLGAVRAGPAF